MPPLSICASLLRASLVRLALLACTGRADLDNIFPTIFSNNPVARHTTCSVPAGVATPCALNPFDEANSVMQLHIQTLPTVGGLYETSQNYRSYASDPKNAPVPVQEHQLPFLITDTIHRVVYIPPSDIFPPEGRWASFTYTATEPINGSVSEHGQVVFSSPANQISLSSFIGGADSWTISGNLHSQEPDWQAFGWGQLSRYVYGADEVQYSDFETNSDRTKWYFAANPGKFYLPELAGAYGGNLRFTVASTYGDYSYLNTPLDWVTIDCDSCDSGSGLRIVRYADNGLTWDGAEKTVSIPLHANDFWMRDWKNTALPKTRATDCEIASVLAGVTRLLILGDFTQAGEGVALDDVSIEASTEQPAYPLACQQGCTCAHDARWRRVSCCGSRAKVYPTR